jgi:hypothetical protein
MIPPNFQEIIDNQKLENRKVDQSGFYDLPEDIKGCNDPHHNPPMHIYIPQGKGYRHICPSCGKVFNLIPPQIKF